MKLIGIKRGTEFSPNMADNDAAILEAVAEELRGLGHEVETMSESHFCSSFTYSINKVDTDCVFGMYRNVETLELLSRIESELGIPCINSVRGIYNASRVKLTQIFREKQFPMPTSWLIPQETCLPQSFPAWLKRGEGCAQVKEDVVYVENAEEAERALQHFKERGVGKTVVACEHLEGDLVKFYGVEGTSFFNWGYASDSHSKFGLEERNGKVQGYVFSEAELKRIADEAAKVIDLPIYGGDCVVASDGSFKIIDFNDWPSFSRCREVAAKAIAQRIVQTVLNSK